MASYNPYALDPTISNAFSSLSRALIGSADDDAALARARASDAQARQSDALAALREAQRAGVLDENSSMKGLFDAGVALASDPTFQMSIAAAQGIPTLDGGFVGPEAPGQLRLGGDQAQALARVMLGEYGTADQMANFADTIGGAKTSRMAENMILGGDASQAQRGALLLDPTGGKYQNPGFAQEELITNDATERWVANLDDLTKRNEDALRYGEGGQGDRDTAAKVAGDIQMNTDTDNARIAYEEYKADRVLEGTKHQADKKFELEQWKVENEVLEISVEPGKKIVLNPAAGERLGLEQDEDGLYVLDGGPKPGSVTVKVGKEDVYLDEATANALGIPKNENNQFVIKGNPELASTSNPNSRNTNYGNMTEQENKDTSKVVQGQIAGALADLPDNIQIGLHNYIMEKINDHMGKAGKDVVSGKREFLNPIVSQGLTKPKVSGFDNVAVPIYFINKWSNAYTKIGSRFSESQFLDAVKKEAQVLGYNDAEIKKILSIDY